MESICRVCLQINEENEEFTSLLNGEEPLSLKLMQCAEVFINSNDQLPKTICPMCVNRLIVAYDFKIQCEKSYRELKNIIMNRQIPSELAVSLEEIVAFNMNQSSILNNLQEVNRDSNVNNENGNDESMDEHDAGNDMKYQSDSAVSLPTTHFDCEDTNHIAIDTSPNVIKEKKKHFVKGVDSRKVCCEHCGRLFTSNVQLEDHIRRHTGEKPFICSTCGKSFHVISELKKHSNIHKTVKPYLCQYCDRRFADWGSRAKHERRHRGERPYTCMVCSKAFSYSYVLSRHMLTHTDAKSFRCSFCEEEFYKKHELDKHTQKWHNVEVISSENQQNSDKNTMNERLVANDTNITSDKSEATVKKTGARKKNLSYKAMIAEQTDQNLDLANDQNVKTDKQLTIITIKQIKPKTLPIEAQQKTSINET